MGENQSKIKAVFWCPKHGELKSPVQYLSYKSYSKQLLGIPVKKCEYCKKYYTPFHKLMEYLINELGYKGGGLEAPPILKKKCFPIVEVKKPCVIGEEEPVDLGLDEYMHYLQEITSIKVNDIVLCNKWFFVEKQECPRCRQQMSRLNVKIENGRQEIYSQYVYKCKTCDGFYISPKNLEMLNKKADEKKGYMDFCIPKNISIETIDERKYYLIEPHAHGYDCKFNYKKPSDPYYDMTSEERAMFIAKYKEPEVPMRTKSFLGELGYSANSLTIERQKILEKAVDGYGKSAVLKQLNFNIKMREKREDSERFTDAIGTWKTDFEYVNTLEDTYEIRMEEEHLKQRELWEREMEEERKRRAEMLLAFKSQPITRDWAWWEKECTTNNSSDMFTVNIGEQE